MATRIKQQIVIVQLDDLHSAFVNWVAFHQFENMIVARKTFVRFLDGATLPDNPLGFLGQCELSAEQARKMNLLLSPHYRTIIRAYYAKYPDGRKYP